MQVFDDRFQAQPESGSASKRREIPAAHKSI
jgi:hypothetical protein